jgi:hypothetical protein
MFEYDPKPDFIDGRFIHLLTTNFGNGSHRSNKFEETMRGESLYIVNAGRGSGLSAFSNFQLQNLFDSTKIVLNIHGNDYEFTAEENRILPALLRGAIVIAEESPLKHLIPYSDYIFWEKIENLPLITREILNNYRKYYWKIHGPSSKFKYIVQNMIDNARNETRKIFNKILTVSGI